MDASTLAIVNRLLRQQATGALGTLRQGAPFVSMVPFVAADDFSAVYIHISALAQHTRAIRSDPRVSLMILEQCQDNDDIQTLARISIQGSATQLAEDAVIKVRDSYVKRLPGQARNFELGDFALFAITPLDARLIAGFGRIHTLTPSDLIDAAG